MPSNHVQYENVRAIVAIASVDNQAALEVRRSPSRPRLHPPSGLPVSRRDSNVSHSKAVRIGGMSAGRLTTVVLQEVQLSLVTVRYQVEGTGYEEHGVCQGN